jgi:hypothetical protein
MLPSSFQYRQCVSQARGPDDAQQLFARTHHSELGSELFLEHVDVFVQIPEIHFAATLWG